MNLSRRQTFYLTIGALAAVASGCGTNSSTIISPTPSPSVPETNAPKQLAGGQNLVIRGAGATFPAPLYQKWAVEFGRIHQNIRISYQSIGSGAGVKQFIAGVVDFAASDTPITNAESAKVGRGVLMIPVTGGSVVIAYNLPTVPNLKLSRATYVNMFAGKITRWNDPALREDNPDADLPNAEINLVHRSDGSGTTETFTRHLSAISKEWQSSFGAGKTINWRVGSGANGNEGVTAQLQQTVGTIGYVEYGFALQNKLSFAQLENRSGKIVSATPESQATALARIQLPDNFAGIDPDPLGDDSYPIVTYTWLLVYEQYPRAEQVEVLQAFLNWALTDGQQFSPSLGYAALPSSVVAVVSPAIARIRLG
jgi:phosphate transport system substrate-binding protein